VLDYDQDGDLDIYLIQGPVASGNRLFRNEQAPTSRLHFSDVTGVSERRRGKSSLVQQRRPYSAA
jgi:hypothetical protein